MFLNLSLRDRSLESQRARTLEEVVDMVEDVADTVKSWQIV